MESIPFIFMSIFAIILIISAFIIKSSQNPRNLFFFTTHPIVYMSLNKAKLEAKLIAKYLIIIGLIILLICSVIIL